MERVLFVRHAESEYSVDLRLNGEVGAGVALTARGRDEARRLGEELAGERIDLCATSPFLRTIETAELALAGRSVPRLVVPELGDPNYGSYEGATLEEYRSWADAARSDATPPGDGESRREIVARYARAFRILLERPEDAILAVTHSLPIAYALSTREGQLPTPRVPLVGHASVHPFTGDELERAAEALETWVAAPTW
jgi:2,3-bisphosphoglycerate-dependent phosphoglycerate mutase